MSVELEPSDGAIVAWFDADGFPVMVHARDDAGADQAGEVLARRWFPAGPENEGALSWEELNASAAGWKGPIRLVRLVPAGGLRTASEPGA